MSRIEWVASDGRWRVEARNPAEAGSAEIDEVTTIYTGTACAVDRSYDPAASMRIGSRDFLGSCAEQSVALDALRSHLGPGSTPPAQIRIERDGFELLLEVERSLSLDEAVERGLFELPAGERVNLVRELHPGEKATLPLNPYWFGPTHDHARAVRSVESRHWDEGPGSVQAGLRDRDAVTLYTTFYARPGTRGQRAGLPGTEPSDGEIQVGNMPMASPGARRTLDVYDGRSLGVAYRRVPRMEITLRNGEEATLFFSRNADFVGFSVATKTTLVTVTGPFRFRDQIVRAARQLRPVHE